MKVTAVKIDLTFQDLLEFSKAPDPSEDAPGRFVGVNDNDDCRGPTDVPRPGCPAQSAFALYLYPRPETRRVNMAQLRREQKEDVDKGVHDLRAARKDDLRAGGHRTWTTGKPESLPYRWVRPFRVAPPSRHDVSTLCFFV
ncbi:MAG: hypothetical protein GXP31_13990 [Kiritimatiellaeota bacterium]|nr:hypothetical protein [Kiritimatiellota bacterium]